MIRVTVQLCPGGDESNPRTLGVAYIHNEGTGSADIGNYGVRLMKSPEYAKSTGVWRKGGVRGFPRKRLGPWDLLFRALRATVGDRNGGAS